MKKIISYGLILFFGLGLLLYSTGFAEIIKESDKSIDTLLYETKRDVEKFANDIAAEKEAMTQPKPASPTVFTIEKKLTQLIDLELSQANIEDVFRVIAEAKGINILLDPALRGRKIDLHLKQVDIDEALELLYNAYGLRPYPVGATLFVSTEEKIKKGTTTTRLIELKNINIKDAKAIVGNLVTTVTTSEDTNTILLVGALEDINKAEAILRSIDLPQPQVALEARIIEINRDALKEIGLDWADSITVNFQETKRKTTLDSPTFSVKTPLHIYKLARDAMEFNTIIHMLEQDNKAKILSNPKITTINNREAEIFIGDRIPYTVNVISGGAITTEVRFVEPGIRLKITPSIIEEDFVVIKIEPEVSYIYAFRGPSNEYPWVKTREATAYVRVKDGQPFVLGGLLSKEDKKNLYKVPFFGSIPIFGNLFKYEKDTGYESELIITVTPTIFK
jgi:type IV pilus assembly protein PilQ